MVSLRFLKRGKKLPLTFWMTYARIYPTISNIYANWRQGFSSTKHWLRSFVSFTSIKPSTLWHIKHIYAYFKSIKSSVNKMRTRSIATELKTNRYWNAIDVSYNVVEPEHFSHSNSKLLNHFMIRIYRYWIYAGCRLIIPKWITISDRYTSLWV